MAQSYEMQSYEMQSQSYEMDVVIYEEGDHWVAQGLQFDITAQAAKFDDLTERFALAVASEIAVAVEKGEEPLASVPSAPAKFHELFARAKFTLVMAEQPALRVANRSVVSPPMIRRIKIASGSELAA